MSSINAKPIHFLLVEDDESHANLIKLALEENNVSNTLDHVWDGAEAMDYLRRQGKHANAPRPHIILLDLKLPKVDGHEVLTQLKADDSLRMIPVVVLTTSGNEIDRAKAYYNHANSYLIKPIDFSKFQVMVKELELYWSVWNQPPIPDTDPT